MKRCGACGSLLVLHKVFARPDSWVCVKAGCPAWRWDGEPTDEPKAGSAPVEKAVEGFRHVGKGGVCCLDCYLALRRENEELKRRLEVLESDRSREANPDSRS